MMAIGLVLANGIPARAAMVEVDTADELTAAMQTTTDGSTIKITADIGLTKTIKVKEGVKAELDLNGFTIKGNPNLWAFENKGELTVVDTSAEQDGLIVTRGCFDNYGKLVLKSGTLESNGNGGGASVWNANYFEMTGGFIKVTGNPKPDLSIAPTGVATAKDSGLGITPTAVITGGRFDATYGNVTADNGEVVVRDIDSLGSKHPNYMAVQAKGKSGKISLYNCSIKSTNGGGCIEAAGGEIYLYDVTADQKGSGNWNSTLLAASNGGTLHVLSGTYTGENYGAYIFTSGGHIVINSDEPGVYEVVKGDPDKTLTDQDISIEGDVTLTAPKMLKLYHTSASGSSKITLQAADYGWKQVGRRYKYLNQDGSLQINSRFTDPISKKEYFFDKKGFMRTGWFDENDGEMYYLGDDGAVRKGWQRISRDWYFFDRETGLMQKGLQTIDKETYSFAEDGAMQTGWQDILVGEVTKKMYFNTDGARVTGWHRDGWAWFFLDDETGEMLTGEQKIGDRVYLFDEEGAMQTGWQKVNDQWIYLHLTDGYRQSGWLYENGLYYYLAKDTGVMVTGWQTIGGQTYYFTKDGVRKQGWLAENGSWYFTDRQTGVKKSGWQWIDGYWYYLDKADGQLQTGLLSIGNQIYLLAKTGEMQTGWRKVADHWYYFNLNDGSAKRGWLEDDKKWYYLNPADGTMVTGTVTIEGKEHRFARGGAWLE